jgi:hypothetical protein
MRSRPHEWLSVLFLLCAGCAGCAASCDRGSANEAKGKPDPTTTDPPKPTGTPPAPTGSASAVASTSVTGPRYASIDCAGVPKDPQDPGGYLEKICRYLVKNDRNVSPATPNTYKISRVEELGDTIRVHLDCCYMGDVATLDKKTGEVTGFRAGAK